MKPSKRQIENEIARLRKFIDAEKNTSIESRMAYLAETVLRWSISETVGWEKPLEEAKSMAKITENDLQQKASQQPEGTKQL